MLIFVEGHDDLVLEDTYEGETFAGDGLSGVLEGETSTDIFGCLPMMSRPRHGGIASPVTSNTNVSYIPPVSI